jgi:hypothetical protein
MEGMRAYQEYVALKLHFTRDKYDYFKYMGKVRSVNESSFEIRKDVFHFRKLERRYKDDLTDFYVANMSQGKGVKWVGDLITIEAEKTYVDWKRHMESITYLFKQDMQTIADSCENVEKAWRTDGSHPEVLRLFLGSKVKLESLVLADRVLGFHDIWDARITDTVVWPDVSRRMRKYAPFVKADVATIKKTMRQVFIS